MMNDLYDLQLFAGEANTQTTGHGGLSAEMKTYYGMELLENAKPQLVHNQFAATKPLPTGGGKTYIAASSLRTIFDAMPQRRAKAVVWLVPSEAILTQTRKALENPDHPYRQRLDVDFGGRGQVLSLIHI